MVLVSLILRTKSIQFGYSSVGYRSEEEKKQFYVQAQLETYFIDCETNTTNIVKYYHQLWEGLGLRFGDVFYLTQESNYRSHMLPW